MEVKFNYFFSILGLFGSVLKGSQPSVAYCIGGREGFVGSGLSGFGFSMGVVVTLFVQS
jgi:hypothetical protein